VLSQYDDDGKLRPVAFFSAKHTAAECNYEIYDKELLAIVKALEEWRPELEGSRDPFDVISDHKNLQTFMTTKQLNQRQVRWSEFLSRFNFRITYRPGAKATIPDALSRLPGDRPKDASDERLQHRKRVLLPNDKVDSQIMEQLLNDARLNHDEDFVAPMVLALEEKSIDTLVRAAYTQSDLAKAMLAALRDPAVHRWPKALRKELRVDMAECTVLDGLIYFRKRLFIPPNDATRLQVVYRTHSSGPGGHPGRVKTLDLVTRTYWWPGMSKDVAMFVNACALCFRTKTPRSAPPGFLKPLEIPFRAWSSLSIDYVVDLPPCRRNGKTYRHILVVVDRLTKMRHFIPVTGLSADELADAFVARIFVLHGAPDDIVSDRGSQFVSDFWRRLSERLKTILHPSSAYNPETDGQTEIVNASLNKYLRAYVNFSQDDWVDWLPLAEFAANNHVSESTGVSPFFANYGFNPRLGIEPRPPRPPNLSTRAKQEFLRADSIAERFERILAQLTAILKQSQQRYEDNANQHRDQSPRYQEGDMVMVDTAHMKTNRPKKKWDDKWEGPYRVLKVYRGAVVVELPAEMRINNSFHTSKVRHWSPQELPGQDEINRRERRNIQGRVLERDDKGRIQVKWEFESILDCHNKNGLHYLVKWKHYKPTWQPAADLKGNDETLLEFHEMHPDKPGPPRWVRKRKN